MSGSLVPTQITHPTVTFSTLAKAMGPIRPTALARLLHGHKYPTQGPRRAYQVARKQAVDLLVDKSPLDPEAPLRAYERDAVRALSRVRLYVPEWLRATRPSTRPEIWPLHGVRISMHPDVDLSGNVESGAVKFSFTKAPLAPHVGSAMASLLWYWRSRIVGVKTTLPAHCIVYEPRLPWKHLPQKNVASTIKSAELACKMIAAIWPLI